MKYEEECAEYREAVSKHTVSDCKSFSAVHGQFS